MPSINMLLEPPPWAFEFCSGCGRDVLLRLHDLTCFCHDPRPRIALAWICDHCDCVLRSAGLFTSWADAIYARQRELDLRQQ